MRLPLRRSSVRCATGRASLATSAGFVPVIALIRLGFGAGILARPDLTARLLGVDRVTARRTSWLASLVGIREVTLAVGTLDAVRRGPAAAVPWLLAQAMSDGGDAVAFLGAAARGHVRTSAAVGLAALSLSGMAAELAAAREVLATRRPS